MPIYLAHGFRWPRDGITGIRVYTILYDLEDVSSEYIQNPHSRSALLTCFRNRHPSIMSVLEHTDKNPSPSASGNDTSNPKVVRGIDFLEQYDPADTSTSAVTQPWAFVCDRIVMIAGGDKAEYHANQLLGQSGLTRGTPGELKSSSSGTGNPTTPDITIITPTNTNNTDKDTNSNRKKPKDRPKTLPMTVAAPFTSPANIHALSINVDEVRAEGTGANPEAWHAFQELRDQIAAGETIGWWVVYNGDPDRAFDDEDEDYPDEAEEEEEDATTPAAGRSPVGKEHYLGAAAAAAAAAAAGGPKSPTGGRMPPPVPPPTSGLQRTSTHSTLTSSQSTTRSNTTASTLSRDRDRFISDSTAPPSMAIPSSTGGAGARGGEGGATPISNSNNTLTLKTTTMKSPTTSLGTTATSTPSSKGHHQGLKKFFSGGSKKSH